MRDHLIDKLPAIMREWIDDNLPDLARMLKVSEHMASFAAMDTVRVMMLGYCIGKRMESVKDPGLQLWWQQMTLHIMAPEQYSDPRGVEDD